MRSVWVKQPFQVEVRDVEVPELEPGELLVRVEACGICGTDLHFARGEAKSWMPLGHEAVGVVEKAAHPADQAIVGRRVVALNYTACNKCEACKDGDWMHCASMPSYMEEDQGWQAGVADYLVLKDDMVFPYENLDPIHATLTEPMSVALDLVETVGIPFGSTVAVFGAGPIGLLAVRICKLQGARQVFATLPDLKTKRHRKRADVARQFGADEVVDASAGNVVDQIKDFVPEGMDRVLVTAPPRTLPDAIRVARYGGRIGLIGIEYGPGGVVEFDVNEFHFKKLELRASHAIPDVRFPKILRAFQDLRVDPSLLITHVYKLEDAQKALEIANSQDEPVVKVVVDCRP